MGRFTIFLVAFTALSCGGGEGNGTSTVAPLVSVRATSFGSGTLSISGTVDLPSGTSEGHEIQLYIARTAGTGGGSETKGAVLTTSADEVRYSVTNLPSGDYQVRVKVDSNGNGIFSESGDLEGWYSGTIVAPVQNSSLASLISLVSVSRLNVNFGISSLP